MDACKWIARARRSNRNNTHGTPQKGLKDVTQPQQDRIPTTKKVCIPTTKSAQAVKWQQLHHMPQHKSNGHECDLNQFDLHKRGTLSAITKWKRKSDVSLTHSNHTSAQTMKICFFDKSRRPKYSAVGLSDMHLSQKESSHQRKNVAGHATV